MEVGERTRAIGFASLLALGINGIVGVGIFGSPAEVAAELPGNIGLLAYAATALFLLPIAFAYGALGRRHTVDGGPYVWARAAFSPGVAFVVGWVTYVSSLFSLAVVALVTGSLWAPLFGLESEPGKRLLAAAILATLTVVTSTGLRLSSVVWSTVTVLKLVPLFVLVAIGFAAFSGVEATSVAASSHEVTPHTVARAVLVVVFAYQGFEIVPILAGSVRRAETAVPTATVLSLVLVCFLYAALHALSVRALPDLAHSTTPLVDAARVYGGDGAAALVSAGARISALGICFGMVNTTPRYLSALGGPTGLGSAIGVEDARLVPQRALWLTAAATVVLVVSAEYVKTLFVLSSLAVLGQYLATLASLVVLARRGVGGLSRRDLWPVPLSVIGIALCAQGAKREEVAVAAGALAAGLLLRFIAHRKGAGRSAATD